MSLGSRFVKRGKTAAIACLASTPREPLLFLYPALARNYSDSSPASIPEPDDHLRTISNNDQTPLSDDKSESQVVRGGSEQDARRRGSSIVEDIGNFFSELEPKSPQPIISKVKYPKVWIP